MRALLSVAVVASVCACNSGVDPKAWEWQGALNMQETIKGVGVAAIGTTAYVKYAYGLQSVDAADEQHPAILHKLEAAPHVFSEDGPSVVVGNYVLFGHAGRVEVFDVSTPSAMQSAAQITVSGRVTDLVLDGTVLYIAAELGGLFAYDVADPEHPMSLGTVIAGSTLTAAISGDLLYAYRADLAQLVVLQQQGSAWMPLGSVAAPTLLDLVVNGTFVYASQGQALRVFDAADPANITFTDPNAAPTSGPAGPMVLDGRYLYQVRNYTSTGSKVEVWDVSAPSEPTVYSSIAVAGPLTVAAGNAFAIAFGAGSLYVAHADGVTVYESHARVH